MTTIKFQNKSIEIDHTAPFGVIDELPAQVVANIIQDVLEGYEFGNHYFAETGRSYSWIAK